MSTSPEDKERIQQLEAALQTLRGRAGTAPNLVASANYWAMNNISTVHTQTGTAAGFSALAGIALIPMFTGIFRVDCSLSFSVNTTAIKCSVEVVSDTVATGAGLTAGAGGATIATAGVGGSFVQPVNLPSASLQVPIGKVLTSDAAGTAPNSLLYGGTAFTTAQIIQKISSQSSLTGLLTTNGAGIMTFEAHGIMYNAIGTAKTVFNTNNPIGATALNTVGFGLLFSDVTTGAEVWTFQSLDFTVQELMLA